MFRTLDPSLILSQKKTMSPKTATEVIIGLPFKTTMANALIGDCSALSLTEQWLLIGVGGSKHTTVR